MCQLYIIAFDGMEWDNIQIFDNRIEAEYALEKIKNKLIKTYNQYNFRIETFVKRNDRFVPIYTTLKK
uniref:Uncharacterized protein n=1 Tax=viral metagenome TaxID=1070528 RepID=A0A6C0DQA5_9ZZZZ